MMFFSKIAALTLLGAVVVHASPIVAPASTTYTVPDVLRVLNNDVSNAYGFCTSLIDLKPVTVTSTRTKTDYTKVKVYTTTYRKTIASTVSQWTETYSMSLPASTTVVVTELVYVLTVTTYEPYATPVPDSGALAKRGIQRALTQFPSSLLSAGCSSYITSTKTVTSKVKVTIVPTITKSKTVVQKYLTTSYPGASFTATSTISITVSSVSGTESTITYTSTLSSGQPSPTTDAGNNIFNPIGCYSEGKGGSALPFRMESSTEMTAAICLESLCQGYRYAGLEYGGECWCGNSIMYNALPVALSDCSQLCSGNPGEFCGNAQRLTIYQSSVVVPPNPYLGNAAFEYLGCYAEPSNQRALVYEFTDDADEAMTPEVCLTQCASNKFKYAAVEYGRECWCDNTLNVNATKTTDDQCSFNCPGNKLEQCGGNDVFNLYHAIA